MWQPAFEKHQKTLDEIGANPNNGLGAVLEKIAELPEAKQKEVQVIHRMQHI